MARMSPESIPPDIANDPRRRAELQVYKWLRELNDSYHIYYSRPWLGVGGDGEEIDGECDFVIAHPKHGVLIIEVKGGGISYDPRIDRWSSTDRHSTEHTIKNPVAQAVRSQKQLIRKLKDSKEWNPRYVRIRHGVILPDCETPKGDLGADKPKHLFASRQHLQLPPEDWFAARMQAPEAGEGKTQALGKDGVRALDAMLAKPFALQMPLQARLVQDDQALHALTRAQFLILGALQNIPRAAIRGGAGTGKTMLAMEEAVRQARKHPRVLLVCFNRALAADCERRLHDIDRITVRTLHSFSRNMAEQAGIPLPEGLSQDQFNAQLPDLLLQAFESRPDLWLDAIIVDEGQDFASHWWTALNVGLDLDGPGILRIFYDDNQRCYKHAEALPREAEGLEIPLNQNLRNTQRIHDVAYNFYSGPDLELTGPEGEPVEWISLASDEQAPAAVAERVGALLSRDMVPPGDIAVLVPNMSAIQRIAPKNRLADQVTVLGESDSEGMLVVDSVLRFKGLDRPVILVVATDKYRTEPKFAYVALSRARVKLIVLGTGEVLAHLRDPDYGDSDGA